MKTLIQRYDNEPDILQVIENGCSDVYTRTASDDFQFVAVVPTNGAQTEVAVLAEAASGQYTPEEPENRSWPGRPDRYPVRIDLVNARLTTRDVIRRAVEAAGRHWGGAWVVRIVDLDERLLVDLPALSRDQAVGPSNSPPREHTP